MNNVSRGKAGTRTTREVNDRRKVYMWLVTEKGSEGDVRGTAWRGRRRRKGKLEEERAKGGAFHRIAFENTGAKEGYEK